MIALALLLSIGQLPYADLIEDSAKIIAFQAAHSALTDDPELLEQHRGFHAFLANHPALAAAEEAFQEQLRLPTFRSHIAAFDEALRDDPALQRRFQDYYDALDADSAFLAEVDALYRLELQTEYSDSDLRAAFAYLKAHPDEALSFLENPRQALPTPEALYPLRNRFRADSALQDKLRDAYIALDRHALAHASAYPWWRVAHGEPEATTEPLRALHAYFHRFPQRFWIWHRRALAWTSYPRERDWLTHFYARIRRSAGLRDSYFEFLAALRDDPALDELVEETWSNDHSAPAWPPEASPPDLTPLNRPSSASTPPPQPARPGVSRPERPSAETSSIEVPDPPGRPSRPEPSTPQP